MNGRGIPGADPATFSNPALTGLAGQALQGLPLPVLIVQADGHIVAVNSAAEVFFEMAASQLGRSRLADILGFSSPLQALIDDVAQRNASVNEYRVHIGLPRSGIERIVDVNASPLGDDAQKIIITLQERTIAEKIDRQMTHRGAARSVTALAEMLAHEIKNPLSGIRGAAQLLESELGDEDRALTRLICEETDRIVKLVDRMDAFSDGRPAPRQPVNIHAVLNHVKQLAKAGFGRHIKFIETYDPSLPPVLANRDQLVQIFLNLVKNSVEAIGAKTDDGEIEFSTAFRPGVRMRGTASSQPIGLPLEIAVRDNGPGVAAEIMPNLFDPFVSNKTSGTGLGLALVAKLVGDHGGIIECDSRPRRTVFKLLLPMAGKEVEGPAGDVEGA